MLKTESEEEEVIQLFSEDSRLRAILPGYEPRKQQKEMLRDVYHAYQQDAIALIEAGTGTGKSLAYLVPAVLWAIQKGQKTVISTKTIALQEQLIHKDLPLVAKALGTTFRSVLVKGMGNYVCLKRLSEASQEKLLLETDEAKQLDRIDAWSHSTHDGSRSDLDFAPSPHVWEKVCAESDTCTKRKCPHFRECHFFRAREEAKDAHILVVNHHFLFADLSVRMESGESKDVSLLPDYERVIIDEAHHIESVATEFFAAQMNQQRFAKLLNRLMIEKRNIATGALPQLRSKLIEYYGKDSDQAVSDVLTKLSVDIQSLRRDFWEAMHKLFVSFSSFMDAQSERQQESKLRVLKTHTSSKYWEEEIGPRVERFAKTGRSFTLALHALDREIEGIGDERLNSMTEGVRHEIAALCNRIDGVTIQIEAFSMQQEIDNQVRWMETSNGQNVHLVDARLDVSDLLVQSLFRPFQSVVLCSATLTTNQNFDFLQKRLGVTKQMLPNRTLIQSIYDSPFHFEKQALFLMPKDVPLPNDPSFIKIAAAKIMEAIRTSRGNAFVLFTSYTMLKQVYGHLLASMQKEKFKPMKQGDAQRKALLEAFKREDRSVLFGTDSFWEGIDVVGEDLKLVIIVKLPFQVPSEPIVQARLESITESGGDPFMEYSVPHSIVKFKQGFGRLIRHKKDRGCIVCLDRRLMDRSYGKLFLKSLPPCQRIEVQGDELTQTMDQFYRSTYHLTK